MGKARKADREFTREQKLVKENKQLKIQISKLRKTLARLDLDRYASVKEVLAEHFHEDERFNQEDLLEKMQKEWKCNEPNCTGFLEIILFNKLTDTYYFRVCNSCSNRTKSQKYNTDVKGIVKKAA